MVDLHSISCVCLCPQTVGGLRGESGTVVPLLTSACCCGGEGGVWTLLPAVTGSAGPRNFRKLEKKILCKTCQQRLSVADCVLSTAVQGAYDLSPKSIFL